MVTAARPLYDADFIGTTPDVKPWGTPLVSRVAREANTSYKKLKEFLEQQYALIPETAEAQVYEALRSQDDKRFCAQVYELFVAAFCRSAGKVDFHPTLADGKTPDFLWKIGDSSFIVDVVTIFDEKDIAEEDAALQQLLRYLGEVEHHFYVAVEYEKIDRHSLRMRAIRDRLTKVMDGLDPKSAQPVEIPYADDGFIGQFTIIPRGNPTHRGPIAFAVATPGRLINPVPAVRGRIREKIYRYKDHGPVIVAICKGIGAGLDWDDVATTLYGPTLIVLDPRSLEYRTVIGPEGLVMPWHGQPPRNTSLAGVLYCELSLPESGPHLEVLYLANPFAAQQAHLDIPTYPVITENAVEFRWSTGEQQEELGLH